MELTLKYDGKPESASIIDANTGEPLSGVKRFTLSRAEPRCSFDELTLTVMIKRHNVISGDDPSTDSA